MNVGDLFDDPEEAKAVLAEYGLTPKDIFTSFTCGTCADTMPLAEARDHIRLFHPEKWSE